MSEIRKFLIIPDHKVGPEQLEKPVVVQALTFLEIFGVCQSVQCLPRAGGLLDQDSLYVFLMRYALECQEQRRQLDQARGGPT